MVSLTLLSDAAPTHGATLVIVIWCRGGGATRALAPQPELIRSIESHAGLPTGHACCCMMQVELHPCGLSLQLLQVSQHADILSWRIAGNSALQQRADPTGGKVTPEDDQQKCEACKGMQKPPPWASTPRSTRSQI
jgi:hypothetical protein